MLRVVITTKPIGRQTSEIYVGDWVPDNEFDEDEEVMRLMIDYIISEEDINNVGIESK